MRTAIFLAIAALTALACSSSSSGNPNSTVEGTVAASTFALGAPTAVDAIDETGARKSARLGADGSFKLELAKGHVYRLVAVGPKGEEPVVFPRTGGRLDKTFRVSSGSAVVALGTVRHFDKAPATGFTIKSASVASGAQQGDGEPGECVDGAIMGTGAPCVDDEEKTQCEGGSAGADDQADGECENGKDAKTGAPCSDADQEGESADPAQAMAIPDKNPPNDIAGCEDGENDGESNDD
ncbi:MAG: hypothetical protein JWP87_806 [Labilithrix sp.]|nr:hypothetical protein [Labilithrix sp.]